MKFCLLVLLSFSGPYIFAQDSTDVIIHADPRVEMLVKKQSDINLAVKKANARTARGYRVLVINTNKRDEAMEAKTKIYSNFPELKAYLFYQSPFFKLKAGNFRTREEAEQYKRSLSYYFPKGVMVINDIIEVTPEKDSDQ
jgi:hypothetical protein